MSIHKITNDAVVIYTSDSIATVHGYDSLMTEKGSILSRNRSNKQQSSNNVRHDLETV